jgi:hypothetical protein
MPGRGMLSITGSDIEEYYDKTEFELMQEVDSYDLKVRCLFCNSNNLQLSYFKVEDYELFNFEKVSKDQNLHFFALKIEKLYDEFQAEISGKQVEEIHFLISCLRDSFNRLYTIPDEKFVIHYAGYFTILYTGKEDLKKGEYNLKIERLIHYGFSREQLVENINNKISTLIFSSF